MTAINVADDSSVSHTPTGMDTPVINRRHARKNRVSHSSLSSRSSVKSDVSSAPSRQVPTDIYQVMGSFQTLLNSIQKTTQSHVCDRSNEALKLIETKRSLQQKLRELSDDSDADEDDKLLIRMNLDTVVQRIRDNIQC